jgi:hypothetical protein
LDEASEIFAYWERNPPVYQMTAIIAQFLGWKPDRTTTSIPGPVAEAVVPAAAPPADWQALRAVPGMATERTPEWARGAVLDFETLKQQHRPRDG